MLGMLSPSFMRWRLHKNHTNRSHIFLKLHHHHHLDKQGGAEFNSAPARRLSAAFGLDLAPTTAGNKQVFVIGSPHGDSLGFEGNMEHCNDRGSFNVRIQNSGKRDLLVSIERKLIHIDFHILQALLQTIGQIASTHGQYKRSPDSMFKAFVSAGLK